METPSETFSESELISVVIAAYNAQQTIEQCVRSVVDQGDPAIEVVVVDDGSTDQTGAMVDELAACLSQVRVIHQENGGPSAARNAGIMAARGEWLMFLDDDDDQAPNALEVLRNAMHADCDAILFPVEKRLPNGNVLREPAQSYRTNAHGMARQILCVEGPYQGYMTNKCVRRVHALNAGELNPAFSYCEDEEWWLRVAAAIGRACGSSSCVQVLNQYLYVYRQNGNGLRSGGLLNTKLSARDEVCELVSREWPDLVPLAQAKHVIWQNRVIVAALTSRGRTAVIALRHVLRPEYRPALYGMDDVSLFVRIKSGILGGAARAFLSIDTLVRRS